MLVAYGPNGQPVIAEETSLEQLQQWSHERMLFCPNCRGIVHVRGGPEKRTQLHFAHQKGECAWSTESESVRHARGKMVLAHWMSTQFPEATVTLEERLPEPNRIADVFVTHADGQHWAIEFQCAPLDVEEWWHRHEAYRKAGMIDTWIVGANRREKQEAFIEAILAEAHEVMFLDPLVTPARIWLRWPIPRHTAQEWQQTNRSALDGWVGRLGYGATLLGRLHEIHLNEQASFMHPMRTTMEMRARFLQTMSEATSVDESVLTAYLRQRTSEDAIRCVVLPLMHAYLRDPDLLRRYNYGRGLLNQPLSEADRARVQKGRKWLSSLAQRGFPPERLKEIVNEIPFVGPYAALASYTEMLISLL